MAGTRERRIAAVLGEEIRVVMARRQINSLQLSRMTDIPKSTMDTLLKGTSAMDVDQLARICKALGLEPGPFYSGAISLADGRIPTDIPGSNYGTRGIAQLPNDPRALLRLLIDNPDIDDELTHRLEQAAGHTGENSSRAKRLAAEIRQLRRAELERALRDLPPQAAVVNGGNQQAP
jgi:DNA-binding Xre family transcriptional regulator